MSVPLIICSVNWYRFANLSNSAHSATRYSCSSQGMYTHIPLQWDRTPSLISNVSVVPRWDVAAPSGMSAGAQCQPLLPGLSASPVTCLDLSHSGGVLPISWLQVSHAADIRRPLDHRLPRAAHWQQSGVTASPTECSVGSFVLLGKRARSGLPHLTAGSQTGDRLTATSHS